ncbi:RNA polymerase sigma-70 factor, ECF subfamily [Terribacillus halophilus]|uniref:RNA polymerase sigma-70 factor, ECF subfamily n=1 Tax=Terribacillus halophilus TaxID=361279 RepID=A0A1G6SEH3_9BACI|nr:sigma-70 family RNA polymerase sigma factor [Terribacillus halophilus]SDD15064.1 RNA polymerase sigma-70 factor, ECF subfamily [Terribacillus halophilus]
MERPKQVDRQSQIEETMDKLSHYCLYLTKNKWDSEEITQEAVLKTLTKYKEDTFPPPVSLLKKIAYHAWIDRIRKRKKEELVSEIHDLATADKKESEQQMDHLRKLTPKQLVVFVLKEAFHFQSTEIAALLGINESAVKALLHRGRMNISNDTIHPLVRSSWENLQQEEILELVEVTLNKDDPAELIRLLPNMLHASKSSLQTNSNVYMAAA